MDRTYDIDLKWLAEQLERPGFSQAGLAKALGRDSSAVSRMLSGTRQIKAIEVPVILAYLGHSKPLPITETKDLYYAALGEAMAQWNAVVFRLDQLLMAVLRPPEHLRPYLALLFRSSSNYVDRVTKLDDLLALLLRDHRNELDTWHSLSRKVRRAGTRRDEDLNAVVLSADLAEGGAVGGTGKYHQGSERFEITVSRLHDDARYFSFVGSEIHALARGIDSLNLVY